jgi:hypothetical protein
VRLAEPRKRSKMALSASIDPSWLVVFHEEKAMGRFPWVDYALLLNKVLISAYPLPDVQVMKSLKLNKWANSKTRG